MVHQNCHYRISLVYLIIGIVMSVPINIWGRTYYLDATNGNDNHNGLTPATAWKTIAKINATKLSPGDSVLFKKGEIWREQLNINCSGLALNPIRFSCYGSTGDLPKITGAERIVGWTRYETTDVYFKRHSEEPTNVFEDDDPRPLLKGDHVYQLEVNAGYWCYDYDEKKLYVHTRENDSPDQHTIEVIQRDFCIYSNNGGDYIYIQNLRLWRCHDAAIYSSENDGWVIRNCGIQNCGKKGIMGRGNPSGPGSAIDWIVENNSIGQIDCNPYRNDYRAGILLRGTQRAIVRNNDVATQNCYAITFNSGGDSGKGATSSRGEIYLNNVHNCQSGIALYNSDSCKIYRNYIHDSKGFGISVLSGSDYAQIYYNVINNLTLSQYGENFNGIDINWASNHGVIYNNSVQKVAYVSCTLEDIGGPCNGWIIKNNIFDARENIPGDVPIQIYPMINTITISHNDYICNKYDPYYLDKVGRWRGIYCTYEEWIELTGDKTSISEDPKFVNPVAGNLHLQSGSPCIDIGTDVGLKQDFDGYAIPAGKAVDLGAYEYGAEVPVELVSFQVNLKQDQIILSWATATETNNFGFEIQRKTVDQDFQSIGFVAGKGTTTQFQQYQFIDSQHSNGVYYYRLKQIDYNGTFEYSEIQSITLNAIARYNLEKNYPNPFNPETLVSYQLAKPGIVVIRVYNILGKEIATLVNEWKEVGRHHTIWNGRDKSGCDVPSGIYILSIEANDFRMSHKMLKVR